MPSRRRSRWLLLLAAALFWGNSPIALAQEATAPPPPVASGASSLTREQFREQLLATFPMEAAARQGGTVIVGEQADISTVNGILASDGQTLSVVGAIYETLVGASPIDGQPVPGLADRWTVSDDGLVYTFHLSQTATWHDGTDLTAEDIKFSFDAVLDPNTGSLYTSTVNQAVASYRVVDPDTFEMTARDRLASFLYEAPGSVLIMPRHVWQNVGFESWSVDPGSTGLDPSRVVGTGPFRFKEWRQGDQVTLTRNDTYYDQVPTIDEVVFRVLPDDSAAVQALITDETDVLQIVPADQVETVEATGRHRVEVYDLLDFTFYAPNLDPERTPLFTDQRVRRALFQALDRDLITQEIFLGYGEAAVGTQPRLSPAYAPDRITTAYPYDPDGARALLDEAGWVPNDDGIREKDGERFEFDLLLSEGSATVEQMAVYLQEAWSDVGVRVNVTSTSGAALLDAIDSRSFEMILVAFTFSPDGSQGPLFTCDAYASGFNFMRYCNPRYDELDTQQKRELDRTRRVDLLVEQTNILWNDLPVGPIRFGVGRTGASTRLQNFYPNGYGYLWSLPYVWVAE